MSGHVIQALRSSPLAAVLSEAELRALASCGRLYTYAPEQFVLEAADQDERLFVLQEGRVALRLIMWPENGTCEGEVAFEATVPGEPFGWAAWVRPDRIGATARAVGPVSLIALDLDRLQDSETLWKVRQWMLVRLYARLQEGGICPPNVQGLLKLKRELQKVRGG